MFYTNLRMAVLLGFHNFSSSFLFSFDAIKYFPSEKKKHPENTKTITICYTVSVTISKIFIPKYLRILVFTHFGRILDF